MFNKFHKSLFRRVTSKQSLFKRQLRQFQIKNDSKNSEKINGYIKDNIEMNKNLMLNEEKPVESYVKKSQKKLTSLFKRTHQIENLFNDIKAKQPDELSIHRKLTLRTMSDSYVEEFLPFKSDPDLLEEYVNPYGSIRVGRIFEDLDLFAAIIAYKHCVTKGEEYPTIVTASVDRLDLIKPLPISDIRLHGHITYVGYSSMEVLVKVDALQDVFQNVQTSSESNLQGEISSEANLQGETLMIARFTMVARDSCTGRSIQVNPLRLENDFQKELFQIAEDRKAKKKVSADMALTRLPPTEEEKLLIHDNYLEYSKYINKKEKIPDNVIWMDETIMESVTFMQPQNRNIHGFVFGGYLMKLAYELAYSNASAFLKSRPIFISLDEISFRKPVQVGSILSMSSQIVYAPGSPHRSFQVAVTADVLDIERVKRDTTNIFHFTFNCDNPKVRRVIPKTYDESMKCVEGRRRRHVGIELRNAYNKTSTNDKSITGLKL